MHNRFFGPKPRDAMTKDGAERLAIEALGFLAGDTGLLQRFFALSGLEPSNVRRAAAEPLFLAAVLDYLASDESLLLSFAKSAGREPAAVLRARELLSPRSEDSI